jgi:cytochrome c oxidase subunit 3
MSGITPASAAGGVTRSTEAERTAAAAGVARRRRSPPNGIWGMALFLCSEVTLFGTILATYFYLDFNNGRWPPAGIKAPSVTLPLVATAVLVLTAVPMWMASRAAAGRLPRRPFKRGGMPSGRQAGGGARIPVLGLIALAMVVQLCYLAGQILLFRHDLNHFRPQDTAYGSVYFTMLAADHAHVLLGILFDAVVLLFVGLRGLTNYWLVAVRATAIYWYVVVAITVLVTLTQLSPSL